MRFFGKYHKMYSPPDVKIRYFYRKFIDFRRVICYNVRGEICFVLKVVKLWLG